MEWIEGEKEEIIADRGRRGRWLRKKGRERMESEKWKRMIQMVEFMMRNEGIGCRRIEAGRRYLPQRQEMLELEGDLKREAARVGSLRISGKW